MRNPRKVGAVRIVEGQNSMSAHNPRKEGKFSPMTERKGYTLVQIVSGERKDGKRNGKRWVASSKRWQ